MANSSQSDYRYGGGWYGPAVTRPERRANGTRLPRAMRGYRFVKRLQAEHRNAESGARRYKCGHVHGYRAVYRCARFAKW